MADVYVHYLRGKRTGGPEAIHQLVDSLNRQGRSAVVVPTDETRSIPRVADYERYDAPEEDQVPDRPDVTVVVPETHLTLLHRYRRARRVCWWLSIDNSQFFVNERRYRELTDGRPSEPAKLMKHAVLRRVWDVRRALQPARAFTHVAQSEYARAFLYARLDLRAGLLTDYTDQSLGAVRQEQPERRSLVAYNHSKGGYWCEQIAAHMPDVRFVPIRDMTREQVVQVLAQAAIYLDMGHHPGRDRMPREAALLGAVVLAAERGGAFFDGDVPLPHTQKIDPSNPIADGVATVRAALERLDVARSAQQAYRDMIAAELPRFDAEVAAAFPRRGELRTLSSQQSAR